MPSPSPEERFRQRMEQAAEDMRRPAEEFIIMPNGQVRQAGATQPDGPLIQAFKKQAEKDLFTFTFGVLDQWWLYPPLHQPICVWLQTVPPFRKCLVVPRGHGKSSVVCQALPQHMIVQPADGNIYFPGLAGTDTRIVMAGEKIDRAQDHLRVIESTQMGNLLLRALWPETIWENPKRQSKKWNDSEMIVPRLREWPDPTIRAIGVGGAVVGAHPNAMIEDDIATENAANSPVVMNMTLRWRENARALLASQGATPLEFTSTTKWAIIDVVSHAEGDATVEVNSDWRTVVEGGKPIYPMNSRGELTDFGKPGAIEQLQKQHGVMFWLLYMNSVTDSALVDFDEADIRWFELRTGQVVITEDERDAALAGVMRSRTHGAEPPQGGRGMTLEQYLDWQDQQKARSSIDPRRLNYIRGARGHDIPGLMKEEKRR